MLCGCGCSGKTKSFLFVIIGLVVLGGSYWSFGFSDQKKKVVNMAAKSGDSLQVHYTGRLKDGSEFDSSHKRNEPLEVTLGKKQVIPGFEDGLIGMVVGEKKTIEIPADQAYGKVREDLVVKFDRSKIAQDLKVEVGQRLRIPQPDGRVVYAHVVGLTDAEVTLDANHPLAGKDLIFDLELVKII
jgi:peptidylprolyl isomerase